MEPFIGEIRAFPFDFTPRGWLLCNGEILSATTYEPLYAIIGNIYGGYLDSFALPKIEGRTIIGTGNYPSPHLGPNGKEQTFHYPTGSFGGIRECTLSTETMPAHNHNVSGANSPGSIPILTHQADASGTSYLTNVVGKFTAFSGIPANGYINTPTTTMPLNEGSISSTGGGTSGSTAAPHNNMQPYLTINYYICYQGYFPQRT